MLDVPAQEFAPLVARVREAYGFELDIAHNALMGRCREHDSATSLLNDVRSGPLRPLRRFDHTVVGMSAPVWSQVDAGVALALGVIVETAAIRKLQRPRVFALTCSASTPP